MTFIEAHELTSLIFTEKYPDTKDRCLQDDEDDIFLDMFVQVLKTNDIENIDIVAYVDILESLKEMALDRLQDQYVACQLVLF